MRQRIFLKAFIVILATFLLSACARSTATAADLTLRDMDGNMVRLSDFKGKIVILDFFATWCPPCKAEVPDFIELQNRYGEQGFTMIGISLSAPGETRAFAERYGINYPVLIGDDYAKAVYGPIRSIPMTFIIDRDFKIVKKYIGYRPKEVFEADLKELLK